MVEGPRRSGVWRFLVVCLLLSVLISQSSVHAKQTVLDDLEGLNIEEEDGELDCLQVADEKLINKMFTDGGPGKRVQLCPSTTYKISSPIIFTSKDQELSTAGYPTDNTRAKLVVSGTGMTAIQGDCRRCARVAIRNLHIDGSRATLGRAEASSTSAALVALGNNEGQVVERCIIRDPRGWVAVYLREGDDLRCTGAKVVGNEIGPAGEEWIPSIDGPDPEESPLGKPLGDGLSLSCRNSTVSDNVFVDTTDAGIVIFGSPGSTITKNRIQSRSLPQMGGILLVDYHPFDGSYEDTVVSHNVIDALGAQIRVGIGIGAPVWSDDMDTVIHSGSVISNTLRGYWMGYGIAVASVKNFTVVDNLSTARNSGLKGERCDESISGPVAFLRNASSTEGAFQGEFVDGTIQYIVCIDAETEGDSLASTFKPQEPLKGLEQFDADEDELMMDPEEEEAQRPKTVVDEILSFSKNRIADALKDVLEKVESVGVIKETMKKKLMGQSLLEYDQGMILSALSGLSTRVANLESERKALRVTVEGLRTEIENLGESIDGMDSRDSTLLSEVLSIVRNSPPLPPPPVVEEPPMLQQRMRKSSSSLKRRATRKQIIKKESYWTSLRYLLYAQVCLLGVWGFWKFRQEVTRKIRPIKTSRRSH